MPRYADKYLIHFRKPLTNICKETFATKLMDCGRALAFNPANPSNYLGTLRLRQLSKNTIEGFKNKKRYYTNIVGGGMSMRLAAVGTDEGDIYLVTTEYASTYLASYRAHATPVYNIQWNNFIPTVFLSCAAEWTVKIWDMNYSKVRRDT